MPVSELDKFDAVVLCGGAVRCRNMQEFLQRRHIPAALALEENAEVTLAKKLLQFGETVPQTLDDFRPNLLANYLYELANTFHGFYEACPVLKSEGATRTTRLALCKLTARVLRDGLGLLGIQVPERM